MRSLPFRMFLPRPDGTKDVMCDNQYEQTRPCDGYVTFSSENELLEGYTVETPKSDTPLAFCSWKCIARSANKRK